MTESIYTFGQFAAKPDLSIQPGLFERALVVSGVFAEKRSAVGTAGPKVGFICVASAHFAKNGAAVDHLTIVDRDWAFCASDVRAGGHDWKPTGGVSLGELELLVRRMRERTGQGIGPE